MSGDSENKKNYMRFNDGSSSGSLFVGNSANAGGGIRLHDPTKELKQELAVAKAKLADAMKAYDQLFRHMQTLEHEVQRYRSMKPAHSFTAKEIKIMLSRLHPDKNAGKEIYKAITQKLLVMK